MSVPRNGLLPVRNQYGRLIGFRHADQEPLQVVATSEPEPEQLVIEEPAPVEERVIGAAMAVIGNQLYPPLADWEDEDGRVPDAGPVPVDSRVRMAVEASADWA